MFAAAPVFSPAMRLDLEDDIDEDEEDEDEDDDRNDPDQDDDEDESDFDDDDEEPDAWQVSNASARGSRSTPKEGYPRANPLRDA